MTQPTPAPEPTGGGGNFFTQKWGPLPVWAWMAGGAAALLIVSYLRNKQNASASPSATDTTGASQIPQFVNQDYTTVSPPNVSVPVSMTPDEDTGDEDQDVDASTNPPPHVGHPKPPTHPIKHPAPRPRPKGQARYYTVKRGDTLWKIGGGNEAGLKRIEKLNPLSSLKSHNYNKIFPGERIRIA